MTDKEKDLLARIIWHHALTQQAMQKNIKSISDIVEADLDVVEQEVPLIDLVLDYMNCPKDNTVELGCSSPDTFCRDSWYWAAGDCITYPEACKFIAETEAYIKEECPTPEPK